MPIRFQEHLIIFDDIVIYCGYFSDTFNVDGFTCIVNNLYGNYYGNRLKIKTNKLVREAVPGRDYDVYHNDKIYHINNHLYQDETKKIYECSGNITR